MCVAIMEHFALLSESCCEGDAVNITHSHSMAFCLSELQAKMAEITLI